MRLKGLDLNLLVALHALLDERSVSRAAERLHVSQPAASAALGRLRDYFNDEILVLHGKRMLPTPYADMLQPEVRRILAQVDSMILMSADFDPARSERQFRIMTSDYVTTVVLQPLAARLERLAPGVSVDVRLPDDVITAEFERGGIDMILAPEEFTEDRHPAELVFEERHVIAGWAKNPLFRSKITARVFEECAHVGVRLGPERTPTYTEGLLEELGVRRHLSVLAPNFSVLPWFLVGSSRIAVMQERLAKTFRTIMPLATAPLPFDLRPMRIMAQYHTARRTDQGLLWLIEQIREQAAAVFDGPST